MTSISTVALHSEHDVVLARQRARQVAALLGFDGGARTRLATAVSEVARNAFQYGEDGRVELSVERPPTAPSILWVRVRDRGPGIDDIDRVLDGSYRSATGLGLGLRGARRLVDRFAVDTRPDGTVVELGQALDRSLDDSELGELLEALGTVPPGDAFTEVLQQNQELLQLQQELAEANCELARASRAKDRFLAMLGHELRNLLNALRSGLEVLRRDPDPVLRERMETMAIGQTEHLRRLVEDLLDASQIQDGRLDVRPEPLDLCDEIEALAGSWRQQAAAAGLELRITRPTEPLWTLADPTRLAQIVGNLLSNAYKFTDPGGVVSIELEPTEDAVKLCVTDTGCGMDPSALETIFEPFAQTDEAKRRMTGGLGLGLAIVRGLAESHGGSLRAESDGPGHGSRFVVHLPATEAPDDPHRTTAVERPNHLRILLIDDHRASVEGLAELLRLEGHEVEIAADGPSALERYREHAPDIVLCDLGLPGMDGFEVARVLRRGDDGGARLLALSGFADPASKQRALDAGFDAHLSKPVNVNELMRRLHDEEGRET